MLFQKITFLYFLTDSTTYASEHQISLYVDAKILTTLSCRLQMMPPWIVHPAQLQIDFFAMQTEKWDLAVVISWDIEKTFYWVQMKFMEQVWLNMDLIYSDCYYMLMICLILMNGLY